jgi:hypothetical protein
MSAVAPQEHLPQRTTAIIAEEIRREVDAVEADFQSAVQHAIRAGELLTEAKKLVRHGQWLPWLAANFEFTRQTAAAYMRIFAKCNEDPTSEPPSISAALAALVDPRPEPVDYGEVLIEPILGWTGLPLFEPAPPRNAQLLLSFESDEERDEYVRAQGIIVAKTTGKILSAWWPPREREDLSSLRFEEQS